MKPYFFYRKTNVWVSMLFVGIWSLICLAFGVLPEVVMYFLWNTANPTSEFGRVALICGFLFAGTGMCFLFGFLAFCLWIAGMKVADDVGWI